MHNPKHHLCDHHHHHHRNPASPQSQRHNSCVALVLNDRSSQIIHFASHAANTTSLKHGMQTQPSHPHHLSPSTSPYSPPTHPPASASPPCHLRCQSSSSRFERDRRSCSFGVSRDRSHGGWYLRELGSNGARCLGVRLSRIQGCSLS